MTEETDNPGGQLEIAEPRLSKETGSETNDAGKSVQMDDGVVMEDGVADGSTDSDSKDQRDFEEAGLGWEGLPSGEDRGDNDETHLRSIWEKAEEFRVEGNAAVRESQNLLALKAYKKGIRKIRKSKLFPLTGDTDDLKAVRSDLNSLYVSLYSNICLVHVKLQKWSSVIKCANEVLTIDQNNIKALFRKAVAYKNQGQYLSAKSDLTLACQIDPKNREARRELENVLQQMKKEKDSLMKTYKGLLQNDLGLYNDKSKDALSSNVSAPNTDSADVKDDIKDKTPDPGQNSKEEPSDDRGGVPRSTSSRRKKESEDEEDEEAILSDSKKLKYCYFGQSSPNDDKTKYAPTKISNGDSGAPSPTPSSIPTGSEKNQFLSTWNKAGTWEEKDISKEATTVLCDKIGKIKIENKGLADMNRDFDISSKLTNFCDMLKNPDSLSKESSNKMFNALYEMTPMSIEVTEIDITHSDCQLIIVRGLKKCVYEFQFVVGWKFMMKSFGMSQESGDCVFTGKLNFGDVTSSQPSNETHWSKLCREVYDNNDDKKDKDFGERGGMRYMVDLLKDRIRAKVDELVEVYTKM